MYYVYVIESQRNNDLYKGFTQDIHRRISQHNDGLVESTKYLRPWKLVYCEIFINKQDAITREKYLKKGWGRKYLQKALTNYLRERDQLNAQ